MIQKGLGERIKCYVYLKFNFSPAESKPEMFIQKIPFSFDYKIKKFTTLSMLFVINCDLII